MIFKKRTVTFVSLIYGYEKENDAEYCLSFMAKKHTDSVEFLNLISRKDLSLEELKALFEYANQLVKELKYEKWYMDVSPKNRRIAERFEPVEMKEIELLGFKMLRFWYRLGD